ncbi:hypothetical protein Trydic_g11815 [Trypoxylus dichotomus]
MPHVPKFCLRAGGNNVSISTAGEGSRVPRDSRFELVFEASGNPSPHPHPPPSIPPPQPDPRSSRSVFMQCGFTEWFTSRLVVRLGWLTVGRESSFFTAHLFSPGFGYFPSFIKGAILGISRSCNVEFTGARLRCSVAPEKGKYYEPVKPG